MGISREVGEEVEWKGGALGRLGMGARPQGGRPGEPSPVHAPPLLPDLRGFFCACVPVHTLC